MHIVSDARGIVCPKCGGVTEVIETRAREGGIRRNRRCENRACDGRITTYEIPAPPFKIAWSDGPLVLIERKRLQELERAIDAALARYLR